MQIIGTYVRRNIVSTSLVRRLSLAVLLCGGLSIPVSAQQQASLAPLFGSGLFSRYSGTLSPVLTEPTPLPQTAAVVPTEVTLKTEDDDFEEVIVTDRPDQTEAPPLTPKGWFQFEFGIQSEFDEVKESKVKT